MTHIRHPHLARRHQNMLPNKLSIWSLLLIPLASAFLPILPQRISKTAVSSAVEDTAVANAILQGLETRLVQGSLSPAEATKLVMDSDFLIGKLENLGGSSGNVGDDEQQMKLLSAVERMDVDEVDELLASGVRMNEETTTAAFWAVVNEVDRCEREDKALPGAVPRMLHHVFDADMQLLLGREKQTTNVTCMQPDDSGGIQARAQAMSYVLDDNEHKNLPLKEGRRCEGGHCCDACSRNIFPTFATAHESSIDTFPQLESFTFNNLKDVPNQTILQFMRLIERVRRTIAHEYGLPLKSILPLQTYSRKYVAGTTQQGGGGGEGDFVILHTDEATHDGYHYSCVLYLSTHGQDFEGGSFVFNDPDPNSKKEEKTEEDDDDWEMGAGSLEEYYEALNDKIRRQGRILKPYNPTCGAAVIFSSGWENMHEVEKITSGVRYAVPSFFTTCPVPEAAYQGMSVGKPKTNEDIADEWLHLLLAHQEENPMVSVGRVKELLMKWHYICTPLDQH
jgi:hypothetical protein